MSEAITFQSLAYRSPKRRIQKIGLYAAIADHLTQRRQRKEDNSTIETNFTLGRIFAVGQYAVEIARARLSSRHFNF